LPSRPWRSCFTRAAFTSALLILAAGIGARAGDLLTRDPGRWLPRPRRLAQATGLLVIVVTLGTFAGRASTRWRLDAARGKAGADSPDVILLILDPVRAANMSAYGYSRPTSPRLTDPGRSGVLFERAFSVAAWSAPVARQHADRALGQPDGGGLPHADARLAPALPALLDKEGYRSGAFMVNGNYAGRGIRIDWGFDHFEDYPATLAQAMSATTLSRVGSAPLFIRGVEERKLFMMLNAIRRPGIGVRERRPLWASTSEMVDNFWEWRDAIGTGPYFAMLNFFRRAGAQRATGAVRG
jgi:hypothetical protein